MRTKKPFTFITGNQNKISELRSVVPYFDTKSIDLPEIQSLDPKEIVAAKAVAALQRCEGPVLVDDTSLYLACMNKDVSKKGLPGPLVKWFLQTVSNKGLVKIATSLGDTRALGYTILAYATSPDDIHFFEGSIEGSVVYPDGDIGFGWDAVFLPNSFSQTLGSMSLAQKNQISMRSQAAQKLMQFLDT